MPMKIVKEKKISESCGGSPGVGKYGHIGILYIRGSIYPKEYLNVIPGVFYTIVGTT